MHTCKGLLLFTFLLHGSRLTKFQVEIRTTLTYMKVGARKLKQVISTGAERSKGRQEQMPMLQVPNWVKRYILNPQVKQSIQTHSSPLLL